MSFHESENYKRDKIKADSINPKCKEEQQPYYPKNSQTSLHIPSAMPASVPLPPQFQFNGIGRAVYSPMYANPFSTHSHMLMPPNFNYIGNQGIFIPQTAETSQFYFIPGNIVANRIAGGQSQNEIPKRNNRENEIQDFDNKKSSKFPPTKNSIYFVPNFEVSKISEDESGFEVDKFETYLVPVEIKKDNNGSFEILAESSSENLVQTPNEEQMSILKKIANFKTQQLTQKITDTIENKFAGTQEVINNIRDNTQGYVIFRYNKDQIPPKQTPEDITPALQNSLQISAPDNGKFKKSKIKRRQKTHKLKLSAESEKSSCPVQSTTSRFRRLRVDDRTQCWNSSGITCIDTRMREIPSKIVTLSETNSIVIPDGLFNRIKQQDLFAKLNTEYLRKCRHGKVMDSDDQEKREELKEKFSFWRYMCSMNNCEFIPQEKELI